VIERLLRAPGLSEIHIHENKGKNLFSINLNIHIFNLPREIKSSEVSGVIVNRENIT
jgi:hypothetical protein